MAYEGSDPLSDTKWNQTLNDLEELSQRVGQSLAIRQFFLATAESCTGGGVGQAITAIPGSSTWYERGFITYSNLAKEELLGVLPTTLATFGAVSETTALEMAKGALIRSHAHIALAVTGIAGPGGATPGKPVGTVCFAWVRHDGLMQAVTHYLSGDRTAVRYQSVVVALEGILEILQKSLASNE
ncbi:NMN aminohydrolase [Gammaproteobacteria bacterium]